MTSTTTEDNTMTRSTSAANRGDADDDSRAAEEPATLTAEQFLALAPAGLQRYPVTRSEVEAGHTNGRRWLRWRTARLRWHQAAGLRTADVVHAEHSGTDLPAPTHTPTADGLWAEWLANDDSKAWLGGSGR